MWRPVSEKNGEKKKSHDRNRLTFSASFRKDVLSCRKDAVQDIIILIACESSFSRKKGHGSKPYSLSCQLVTVPANTTNHAYGMVKCVNCTGEVLPHVLCLVVTRVYVVFCLRSDMPLLTQLIGGYGTSTRISVSSFPGRAEQARLVSLSPSLLSPLALCLSVCLSVCVHACVRVCVCVCVWEREREREKELERERAVMAHSCSGWLVPFTCQKAHKGFPFFWMETVTICSIRSLSNPLSRQSPACVAMVPLYAEASKIVMRYVASVCGKESEVDRVMQMLLQSNPLLEGEKAMSE